MSKEKAPVTPAVRMLRQEGVAFTEHLYPYVEKGGTANAARQLGVEEHEIVKTLVMEDDRHNPLIVLMHGDLQVSTRELARAVGVKTVAPCTPEAARERSGYPVGGTSPFGTRHPLPVYVEETILELPLIFINGGHRGFQVRLDPKELVRVLKATPVRVGIAPAARR
ncbi:MAG: Cys-tRNA(Pro) deacylase [Armatimonadetes bacterium]|nr:Cys-tRNA(Pro) deacylase [Armatimonadota bacterium]